MGKIANRQSLAFSERGQLSQAIPQFHVERMLNERTTIARSESQHNECKVCENDFLCFGGRYDCQRTLAMRIAATTLASDSAITIARFRPSKFKTFSCNAMYYRYCWEVQQHCRKYTVQNPNNLPKPCSCDVMHYSREIHPLTFFSA